MASDPKKRQKKLERRAAKRKEKKHELVRAQSAGLAERLTAAAHFPVLDCWISGLLETHGLGWVVLSRAFPNGQVAVANFLVDRYCLGVKNIHAEVLGRFTYDAKYTHGMAQKMDLEPVPPADARKLVEQAVAYARRLGFAPHADYARAARLFGSIDAAESRAEFEFGKDGKPCFISGPNESPRRCREIMTILGKHGPDSFDYVVSISPDSMLVEGPMGPEDDEDDGYE